MRKHFLLVLLLPLLFGTLWMAGCSTIENTADAAANAAVSAAVDTAATEAGETFSERYIEARKKAGEIERKTAEIADRAKETADYYAGLYEYIVQPGDSLWSVAATSAALKFNGRNWPVLLQTNNDLDANPDLVLAFRSLFVRLRYSDEELDDAKIFSDQYQSSP
jgi:hypothetical protein